MQTGCRTPEARQRPPAENPEAIADGPRAAHGPLLGWSSLPSGRLPRELGPHERAHTIIAAVTLAPHLIVQSFRRDSRLIRPFGVGGRGRERRWSCLPMTIYIALLRFLRDACTVE